MMKMEAPCSFISAAITLNYLLFELVHETMPFVRLFYFLIHWINDVVDTIAMNIPFCHVYAISDPGNSRYTGVLPLFKGGALTIIVICSNS